MKHTRLVLASALAASGLALTACGGGGSDPLAAPKSTPAPSDTIVVGSADFAENVLLADIYASALTAKGVKASVKPPVKSREVAIPALKDGSLDLIPEYTGNLLLFFDPKATAVSSDDVYAALKTAVDPALTVLDQASAQDKDAVVVTKETADKYHLTSIGDLAAVGKQFVLAGPSEWKTRSTGVPGLKAKYGITFKTFKVTDASGPLTVDALKTGKAQAGNVFTTDPSIAKYGWVSLADPKNLFAAQNVVPLINKAKATPTVTSALNAVSAKLTTPVLAGLAKQVISDKEDPQTVADKFLADNGLN